MSGGKNNAQVYVSWIAVARRIVRTQILPRSEPPTGSILRRGQEGTGVFEKLDAKATAMTLSRSSSSTGGTPVPRLNGSTGESHSPQTGALSRQFKKTEGGKE
jgi:hypothetical protein